MTNPNCYFLELVRKFVKANIVKHLRATSYGDDQRRNKMMLATDYGHKIVKSQILCCPYSNPTPKEISDFL